MVDCSGSMDYPATKMRGAREATAAAVDTLRDGTHFALVAGTRTWRRRSTRNGGLAVADARTRAEAKEALRRLSAGGGTAIGTWLRLADRLLSSAELTIRHGILLTDGRNEHESPEELRAALDACAGRFTCDARGVGTDWEVKEVTGIASALLGTAASSPTRPGSPPTSPR
ncbi:VWA domain-containing protein [Streptomyces tanashiensis]